MRIQSYISKKPKSSLLLAKPPELMFEGWHCWNDIWIF